jgi:hypothetical protein
MHENDGGGAQPERRARAKDSLARMRIGHQYTTFGSGRFVRW